MDLSIKESIEEERKMERGSSFGQMVHLMKENSSRIIFKAMEFISGVMEKFMKENG